MLRAWWRW